nr:immunoglobulin heavy chain junction region [Macaca mulatta]
CSASYYNFWTGYYPNLIDVW